MAAKATVLTLETLAEIAAGGHAIVARSVDDVLRALREMGAPIEM